MSTKSILPQVKQKLDEIQEAYYIVIAENIEQILPTMKGRGIGATVNTITDLLTRLGGINTENPLFASIQPLWSLVGSLIHSLLDKLVMDNGALKVIEATELDEGTKKSLYLMFRSADLRSINGRRGHMIELKELIEEIPAFVELGQDIQQAILRGMREVHHRYLRNEMPAEETVFLESLIKALRDCSLDAVEAVLIKEIKRLHTRIVEVRNLQM